MAAAKGRKWEISIPFSCTYLVLLETCTESLKIVLCLCVCVCIYIYLYIHIARTQMALVLDGWTQKMEGAPLN